MLQSRHTPQQGISIKVDYGWSTTCLWDLLPTVFLACEKAHVLGFGFFGSFSGHSRLLQHWQPSCLWKQLLTPPFKWIFLYWLWILKEVFLVFPGSNYRSDAISWTLISPVRDIWETVFSRWHWCIVWCWILGQLKVRCMAGLSEDL